MKSNVYLVHCYESREQQQKKNESRELAEYLHEDIKKELVISETSLYRLSLNHSQPSPSYSKQPSDALCSL